MKRRDAVKTIWNSSADSFSGYFKKKYSIVFQDWKGKKKLVFFLTKKKKKKIPAIPQDGCQNIFACVGKWLPSNVWNHLSSAQALRMTVLYILQKIMLIDLIYAQGFGHRMGTFRAVENSVRIFYSLQALWQVSFVWHTNRYHFRPVTTKQQLEHYSVAVLMDVVCVCVREWPIRNAPALQWVKFFRSRGHFQQWGEY